VEPVEEGFAIRLDERPVRTPNRAELAVPTQGFAERIAEEWRAQEDVLKPDTMPFTRAANTAIDKVSAEFDAVAEMLISYGETDLLCYRAENPQALQDRQATVWGPLIDWVSLTFDAPLNVTVGVLPVTQPGESLVRIRRDVRTMTPFQLVGFHDLVVLSGSLVIGLAVVHELASAEELWDISRLDELWQIEQWGEDEEAAAIADLKRDDFLRSFEVYKLSEIGPR
jgi:chaperone required for assembly of F1-ATPase